MIVPRTDTKLKTLVDNGISQLLDNGEIQAIVEKYGVPYFAPVDKPDPMKYRTPE
jgi:ABC-type amino acid transport substrate-binding protein